MESIYSSSTHHTRVDGILNLEVGVSRIPGHPGYRSDAWGSGRNFVEVPLTTPIYNGKRAVELRPWKGPDARHRRGVVFSWRVTNPPKRCPHGGAQLFIMNQEVIVYWVIDYYRWCFTLSSITLKFHRTTLRECSRGPSATLSSWLLKYLKCD